MSDEKPVPETLESIAAKIDALSNSMDAQFVKVDARIRKEIAEAKAQLGVKIEAVDEKVKLVYDEVIAQRKQHKQNDREHATFEKRLGDHDTRILALEREKTGGQA